MNAGTQVGVRLRTVRRGGRHLVVALLSWASVSCGFPTQDSSSPLPDDVSDTGDVSATTDAVLRTEEIVVWFLRDDLLVQLPRQVVAPAGAAAVVAAVAAGVSPAEGDRGYRSALLDPDMVDGAESARGTATVALSSAFAEVPTGDQVLALGQLVLSITELRGVGRVRFQIDGEAVAVPLPDGTSTDDAVTRDDFAALVAPG